jgi:hypothetical protein
MAKRLAVLVRERQAEALRVAVGLTLHHDRVEVFVLDRQIERSPGNLANLEALGELEMPVATNCAAETGIEVLSNAELARRIAACDVILPY